MPMDRLRHLATVWNWLPAFRAVAEYQSIQKAAVSLNISASALSRTVRLLEDAIGMPLFVRDAAGLTLTTFGAELLRGTRDAMRRVDDVILGEESTGRTQQTFTAAATGPISARVLDRGMGAVVRDFGAAHHRTTSIDEETAAAELLRGNVDVVVLESDAGIELVGALTSEHLGDLELALLAPPAHPLAGSDHEPLEADLRTAKIVVLAATTADGRSSQIVAAVASMESAEQIAERGPFLALLPPTLTTPTFRPVARVSKRVRVTVVFRRPLEGEAPSLVRAAVVALRSVVAGGPA